jgi:hypothetical protein
VFASKQYSAGDYIHSHGTPDERAAAVVRGFEERHSLSEPIQIGINYVLARGLVPRLTGEVRVNFRSDYLPLDKMTKASLLPGWARVPIVGHAGLLLPVRPHALAAALAALHPQGKGRDIKVVGVLIRTDDRIVAAGVVEAVDRESARAPVAQTAPQGALAAGALAAAG